MAALTFPRMDVVDGGGRRPWRRSRESPVLVFCEDDEDAVANSFPLSGGCDDGRGGGELRRYGHGVGCLLCGGRKEGEDEERGGGGVREEGGSD